MRRSTSLLTLFAAGALFLGACGVVDVAKQQTGSPPAPQAAATAPANDTTALAEDTDVNLVIAPAVKGQVNEEVVLMAYRRSVEIAEKDFGIRPLKPVTVYVDPDSAIGLEDALGLSAGNAIHLRAGRSRDFNSLMPLMLHEYTHVLQHQIGRLRPQWFIEGQADHQSWRALDPASAAKDRKNLYRALANDVKAGRAPMLADLRGNTGWKSYIDKSGAGRAYGWGNVATAFIEDTAGFEAVGRILKDTTGPNTMSSFDEAVRRETGLGPEEFDAAVKAWLLEQAQKL